MAARDAGHRARLADEDKMIAGTAFCHCDVTLEQSNGLEPLTRMGVGELPTGSVATMQRQARGA